MIFKTLEEVPSEVLKKADLISISWIDDMDYRDTDDLSFTRDWNHNGKTTWYKKTYEGRSGYKTVPITEANMMKLLKQKYDYYNKQGDDFVIDFWSTKNHNSVYVTPKPNRELCSTGITKINLDDDDAFEKMEKALGGLNGRRTKVTPKTRRAPVKKRKFVCPEKMF